MKFKIAIVIIGIFLFAGCKTLSVKTPDGMDIKYINYGDSSIEAIYFKKTDTTIEAVIGRSTQVEQDININGIGDIK